MSGLTLTPTGVTTLATTLAQAGEEIADLDQVHRVEGQRTLSAAVIPVRTGHLADTAAVVAGDDGFTLTAAATYAGFVHTRDPFFTRAVRAREAALTAAVADHVDDALSTVRGA